MDADGHHAPATASEAKFARPQPTRRVSPWKFAKRVFNDFLDHDVLSMSAALSFYTLLSFAPLTLLAVWASSLIGPGVEDALLHEIASLAGNEARAATQAVIDSAQQRPTLGSAAGIAGFGILRVGATTVFAPLQTSLNRIWGVRAQPSNALWGWLRRRVLSMGVIAAISFVMVVSLLVSSALGLLFAQSGMLWDALNQFVATIVFSGLFALLFRYLPDARLGWQPAAWGGLITAILFGIGKAAIGLYLAHGNIGGAYGAAGSLAILLVWVYYSGAIFFFGAELVQAWLTERGQRIEPTAYAVSVVPERL